MNKKNILNYLSQTFMIYGITTVILNIFIILFGTQAQEMSTIFSLGSKGMSISTNLQFLLAAAILVAISFVFEADFMIKRIPFIVRTILLFVIDLLIIIGFVLIFGWFPYNQPLPWVMFAVCFAISCIISTVISSISEKQENKKLEEALRKFKEEQ